MKTIVVAGTRPNFIKIASLMREFRSRPDIDSILVHTGQHYDHLMSDSFFEELDIPQPDVELGVKPGSHAELTAQVLVKMEEHLLAERPDVLVVVGDVNSTLAASLAASKVGVDVAHVEAGLRSGDRSMPEEVNRVVTDAISTLLFTSERSGTENLLREGVAPERIHFVGNVMIDTLMQHRKTAERSPILERLGLRKGPAEPPRRYAVLTLHRPSNVDEPEVLGGILSAVAKISRELPVVFPCHPRTRAHLDQVLPPAAREAAGNGGLVVLEPLGYLDFLHLMSGAAVVLTDSGGIQEETTVLGVPCLTLRRNTERPVTVSEGTNVLAGVSPPAIEAAFSQLREKQIPPASPELWDGKAADRVADILQEAYGSRGNHYE